MINVTSDSPAIFSEHFGSLYGCVLLIECFIGIFCNSIVIVAFARKYVLLTPFNMLLLNLSLADILADVFFIPTLFVEYIALSTNSVEFVCSMFMLGFIPYIGFGVNSCTVAYISFIRIESFENGWKILNRKVVSCFLSATWVLTIASITPVNFMISIDSRTSRKTGTCATENKNDAYTSALVINGLFFIIPLTILVLNFIRTIKHLWDSSLFQQSVLKIERKQITVLLFSLTVVYIIGFLPNFIRLLLRICGFLQDEGIDIIMRRLAIFIGLLTTISDPVLYALCSKGFRRGLANSRNETRK